MEIMVSKSIRKEHLEVVFEDKLLRATKKQNSLKINLYRK